MGTDCTDILSLIDYRGDGSIHARIVFLGIHLDADTPADRATLRNAATGSDAAFRAALVSVGGSGTEIGGSWDHAPTVDSWYSATVVASRTRLRSLCAALPT